jgi:hypothetical protein
MAQLNIEERVIENERLEIKAGDIAFLGPNLALRNCTVVIGVTTKNLILINPKLIDCTIEVKKELKNLRWCGASLKGCKFTGRMSGNDFGRWPYSEHPELGGIEDCDFTGARLGLCRFIDCDVSTLKFPSWPYFTLLDPLRRQEELLAAPWPGTSRIMVQALMQSPPQTVAATDSATALARRSGTTEEAIRAVLDTLDGVIL